MISGSTAWGFQPLNDLELAAVIDEFQYENNYEEVESTQTSAGHCWVYSKKITVTYPTSSDPLVVNLRQYIPNRNRLGTEQVPAVLMLPPIGGENMLDRRMAETFCANSISAIILTDDFGYIDAQSQGDLRPVEDHQETFYRVGAAVKGTLALISDDEQVNETKVGLFGVSLGGVLGAFMMGTQEAISAGYFVVAGGDIPEILAVSQQSEVSRIRRKRMETEGLHTQEEYEDFLRQHILFDPLDMAKTMLPETIEMVVARRDTSVPTPNQEILHSAYGEPSAHYHNYGHSQTVIATLFWASRRRDIANFFNRRFATPNPRPNLFNFYRQLMPMAQNM